MEIDGVHIHEANVDALDAIEWLTKNVQKVQDQVLSTILYRNRNTEYLSRFWKPSMSGHLPRTTSESEDAALDKEWFRKMVPVVDYEDVEPYIHRLVHHDDISTNNVLCAQPISEFLASSGTSAGERKLMPTIAEDHDRRHFFFNLLMPVMNQYSPGLENGKGLYFMFIKAESKTASGLAARPVMTSYYKSAQFKQGISKTSSYTSPIEVILCPDFNQSLYCQLLCGLVLKDEVVRMGAVFASSFLRAIRFLEGNWTSLCHDIEQGQLNSKITHLPMRAAVMKLLFAPNPALAESIRMECSKNSWQGIIGRIWKSARFIDSIVTGTMSQYIPTLDYYSGGLPLVCNIYGSSECFFGINLKPFAKPSEVSYTFLPNLGYFEFMPFERSNDRDDSNISNEILELAHVELGKEYEVIVTTYAGLYRYKVGDVVRVTGFHNQAPQFAFVRRKKVLLSLDAEKTDEATLHKAIQNAAKLLEEGPWKLLDYTTCTDASSVPGHYVIFWEIHGGDGVLQEPKPKIILPESLLEECCLCVEESLDTVYRQSRCQSMTISPLEIRLVKRGTFDALMDYFVSQLGASVSQYKTPRCITSTLALSMLNANVLQASFSPRSPSLFGSSITCTSDSIST